ncbi:hypothetical protein B0F90DRAFT_1761833 [Multifurca ochricompacta]|uniref:Uncharacterized protein n=1 Tax=Multifurca ochricompacta TaxID=376703 RepID=A0AAD4LXM8_9AGAM|nr:hypothetical protein B0F90DRAFT_1761833 [Multifurca ochricompacta]
MFATLSSFLPSALQQGSPNPANGSAKVPGVVVMDDVGVKKKERRTNHESFIVVRPPPSKSNHPLNLQVQLVPPQSRDRDRTRSMDISTSSQDQEDNILSRTTSNRSDVSMYSGYSSVTSFSSVASTSTTSSRRMIIPLYNLQAHNVMTNVIVDAGTDAKVAKFQKRGLELLGLAVLEPVEVFGSNSAFPTHIHPPSSNRTSIDEHHDIFQHATPRIGGPDHHLHTPASSALSLSSGGAAEIAPPSVPIITPAPTNGPKKLFGKFFKKKDSQPSTISPSLLSPTSNSLFRLPRSPVGQSLAVPSQGNPAKRNSFLGSAGPTSSGHHVEPPTPSPTSSIIRGPPASSHSHLQPAVLGIHPSCSSPFYPPQGRPHSYTWIVRRWIKGSHDGLLSNVIGHMNHLGLSDERRHHSRTPTEEGPVEVRFIWTRGKKKRRLRGEGGGGNQSAGVNRRASLMGRPPKRMASTGGGGGGSSSSSSATAAEKRLSIASGHSVSTGSEVGSATGGRMRTDDDGDESDPEDSETPWTCTLVISRLGFGVDGGGGGSADGGGDSAVRVRVATFSPTPHHPKVVALLKVPFPLPDIIIDRMQVCRRTVSAQGIARPNWNMDYSSIYSSSDSPNSPDGLVLTAEEIKDIISSTGLWLVVRESIGGVGKINRKGDGWRIRA